MPTSVAPHQFTPLRRFFNKGRCRSCYMPETLHPAIGWESARPIGDKSPAVVPVGVRFQQRTVER